MDRSEPLFDESFSQYCENILDDPRSKRDYRSPNALGRQVLRQFCTKLSAEQAEALDLSELRDSNRKYAKRSRLLVKIIWKIDDKRRREGCEFSEYDALNRMAIYAVGDRDVLDITFFSFFCELLEILCIDEIEFKDFFQKCLLYKY